MHRAATPKSSKKKSRPRDKDATVAALIQAGEQLFARHGFSGTTLDMLATAGDVNKALVSYYFGSKEGLYDAVISALVSDVVLAVSANISTEGNAVSRFRSYIRSLAYAFSERPTFGMILLREYMGGSMQERAKPFQEVFKFFQMTKQLYEEGRKEKVFRKLDPHQLHLSIIGPLVHFTMTMEFRKRTFHRVEGVVTDPSIDEFASHLEKLLLDGMNRGETLPIKGELT